MVISSFFFSLSLSFLSPLFWIHFIYFWRPASFPPYSFFLLLLFFFFLKKKGKDKRSSLRGALPALGAPVTPLHLAALFGSDKVLIELLQHSNASPLDKLGHSPLWFATLMNHARTVHMLLQAGADPYAGKSSLHLAVAHGHADVVKLFLMPDYMPPKADLTALLPVAVV